MSTRDICGRCQLPIKSGDDAFVLYVKQEPCRDRIVVHAVCIADEAAEGRLKRESAFAFRVA